MVDRTSMTQRLAFLPEQAKDFLRRRAVEAAGFAIFALAVALSLALMSFDPRDPSFNNATSAQAINLMGRMGAFTSDLLLQTLGGAGGALVLVLAAWSWRVVSHRGIGWVQLCLLPPALVATAGALTASGDPPSLHFPAGFGGAFGAIVVRKVMLPVIERWGLGLSPVLLGLILWIAALLLLAVAAGLSRGEWRAMGRGTIGGAALAARGAVRLGNRVRRGDAAEAEDREPRLRSRPKRLPVMPADADDETADEDAVEPQIVRRMRNEPRVERPQKPKRPSRAEQQPALDLTPAGEYQLPALSLLATPPQRRAEAVSEEALEQNARMLESTLDDFGVNGQIVKVRPGPVVTLYELEPAPGTKSSRVIGLADDIARSMSAVSARVAVIPGRNAIGIELPNANRETVYLRELLASTDYETTAAKLTLALGKDIGGAPVIADLARMPHLLIAGTTGSGKSVAVNTMILSLLYRMPPEQCRFIMIDPKMLELSVYDGIPHLLAPVVTDASKAVVALKWTVREMEDRYRKMSELGVRNIAGYNQRLAEARAKGEDLSRTVQTGFDPATGEPVFEERALDLDALPFIVVIVDEMADLMMVAGKDIEASVQRLAQMARAAGIHLIMATQRPSVDVITGTIKANFPTRISFQVTSKIDSRTILGEQGAEQLLGMGDMLYMPGAGRISRVHGPFVSDTEVEKVVAFLKDQGEPTYLDSVTDDTLVGGGMLSGFGGGGSGGSGDDLYDQAVALVTRERKASTSFIQRHLQIGYNRAARIIEQMEVEGVVGKANHVGKREVLARDIDDRER
ncbi:MAG TPA: DNA translocase FtsK 4TM domain-containing protein [Candidatus Cybelea sp.]|nr:DNA translocase FtsK 4TM domain-containing protein [Candidatus Cybelea sp.]